tara:strand:+ start:141 stop:1232 length:1092 start_codon:yes stop_codon:yes gene_type:complete
MAYTTIDDPSAHFQIATYNGDSNNSTVITNDGNSDLQPDWVWIKSRNEGNAGTGGHMLFDSSRGIKSTTGSDSPFLVTNSTSGDQTNTNGLQAIGTDSFTPGSMTRTNESGDNYVAWQWKCGGGSTSTNTDGSINTTVQSNSTAGFNIITYTGTGGGETLGHNLGVAPDMWIFKRRDSTGSWAVGFNDSSILGGTSNYLILQSTGATSTYNNFWGSSPANSNVMRIAGDATIGGSGSTYVAYVFAQKQGYSKFGKYVGNGNADGVFVYTGFKPAFVLVKSITATHNWHILDNKRDPSNVVDKYVNPDNAAAEATFTFGDFLSNGFKWRSSSGTSFNESGTSYIFMAFAENPFVTSTGIPTTAR